MSNDSTSLPLQQQAVIALEDMKGVDIRTLDVRQMTSITDYMIIVTGTSARHVRSLANNVAESMSELIAGSIGIEGENEAEWILVDLQDVVVHVMQQSARDFYQLERLWDTGNAVKSTDPAMADEKHA